MKKFGILVIAITVLFQSSQVFGASKRGTASSSASLWYGVSMDTAITRSTLTPSISLLFDLKEKLMLQTYFNIQTTNPFNFGVGGAIKYLVSGAKSKGMHLVGGLGLGTTGATETFFVNFLFGAGIHAEILSGLMLSADTGLSVRAGGGTQLAIGGTSALLGLSLHLKI